MWLGDLGRTIKSQRKGFSASKQPLPLPLFFFFNQSNASILTVWPIAENL